jgi:hypothetical protein
MRVRLKNLFLPALCMCMCMCMCMCVCVLALSPLEWIFFCSGSVDQLVNTQLVYTAAQRRACDSHVTSIPVCEYARISACWYVRELWINSHIKALSTRIEMRRTRAGRIMEEGLDAATATCNMNETRKPAVYGFDLVYPLATARWEICQLYLFCKSQRGAPGWTFVYQDKQAHARCYVG